MNETTTWRLTPAEIGLLREIAKWRRKMGFDYWRARWPIGRFVQWSPPRRGMRRVAFELADYRGLPDDANDKPVRLGYGPTGGTYTYIEVASVTEAVDVLVAFGVLPARFSSAYTAGWEALGTSLARPLVDGMRQADDLAPANRVRAGA